jgi:microcystin degradation protein MlrC
VEHADALVGYHAYPHTDMYETGERAARLLLRQVRGEVRPTMAWQRIPMIVPPENAQTTHGPSAEVVGQAREWEAQGAVLAASVFPVQPWLDVPDQGSATVIVTDDDPAAAFRHAHELAEMMWAQRHEYEVELVSVEEAIRRARRVEGGPVVLAESADSTGSGSPGDSPEVLRGLLAAGFDEPAAVYIVDPAAVAAAIAAGVGSEVSLTVGGQLDPAHHEPLPVTGRVHLLADGTLTYKGKGFSGVRANVGRAAVLQVGSIAVLLSERPGLTMDPEIYRAHGIEPRDLKIVAVKSPNFFRANYEPFAAEILMVDTPGVSPSNLRAVPFRHVRRPLWPLEEFEWSGGVWE